MRVKIGPLIISTNSSGAVLLNGNAGTSGQALISQGPTGVPAWGTVGGGGGSLVNFTDSLSSSSPNDTVPSAQLKATGTATDIDAVISPKGNGALLAQVPDNGTSGGNKRGIRAVDLQQLRTQAPFVASGSYSTISGGRSNTAAGYGAVIGGGNLNSVEGGTYNAISGGEQNTIYAQADYSVICGGQTNALNVDYAFIGGGSANAVSAEYGVVLGGSSNVVEATHGAILSGTGNLVTASYSLAHGDTNNVSGTGCIAIGTQNNLSGPFSAAFGSNNVAERYALVSGIYATARGVWGARAHGIGSAAGTNQSGDYVLRYDTTDATPTPLTVNGSGAGSINQIKMDANQALSCSALVVARLKGSSGVAKMWELKFGAMTNSPNSNIALIGTPIKTIVGQSTGTETWDISVQVDSGNGAVSIVATGAASTNIRWHAAATTAEVVFN